MGGDGVYTNTFEYERDPNCIVCGDHSVVRKVTLPRGQLLAEYLESLKEDPSLQLKKPSVVGTESGSLFMQAPPSLKRQLEPNLSKPLCGLIKDGEVMTVTDPMLQSFHLNIQVVFCD
jgi:ubiquitin-activating enzyme E1 C